MTWANRNGNAEIIITPDSFRPNTPWDSDLDDYVLVARDPEASTVHVTWALTEDGNDEVTKGEFDVATGPVLDSRRAVQSLFLGGREQQESND